MNTKLQQVAFQGERGAYSEAAAIAHFGPDIAPYPCAEFDDLFRAVIEGVCEAEVRRQLGGWVLTYHPHDVLRRAQALGLPGAECARALAEVYAVPAARVAEVLARS